METNKEEKIIENLNKNLKLILEEIQFNSTDLIFEIIEIFVDNNKLYSKCILQLLSNYYEKIAKKYFEINSLLKKEPNNFEQPLKILRELQERIKFAEKFCQKPLEEDAKAEKELISIQEYIEELSLKISVKEIILGNMVAPIDLNLIGEKERLEKILEQYKKCKSIDTKDLIEFEKILKKSFASMTEDEKYAQNFLENFNQMENDNYEKFLLIFVRYNLTEYYDTDVLSDLMNFEKRYETIVKLCAIYQKYNQNLTPGAKKNAITEIQIYLNHLKTKCNDKNKPLFKTD